MTPTSTARQGVVPGQRYGLGALRRVPSPTSCPGLEERPVNKSELVSRLTDRLGGDRALATTAVNGVLVEIEGSVARGERVSLIGFGTFDRRERAARTGRNPQTGAAIQLGASVAPVFRPGAGFRSLLTQNGSSAAVPAVVPAVMAA